MGSLGEVEDLLEGFELIHFGLIVIFLIHSVEENIFGPVL